MSAERTLGKIKEENKNDNQRKLILEIAPMREIYPSYYYAKKNNGTGI